MLVLRNASDPCPLAQTLPRAALDKWMFSSLSRLLSSLSVVMARGRGVEGHLGSGRCRPARTWVLLLLEPPWLQLPPECLWALAGPSGFPGTQGLLCCGVGARQFSHYHCGRSGT